MNNEQERWSAVERMFQSKMDILERHVAVSNDWTVAEFGVGKWGFGRFVAKRFKRAIGLDIVDYSARHDGMQFFLSDGRRTEIPDECVDLVMSHSVLEHVGDLDAALTEINRIARPEGFFHLTVNPLYFSSYGAHLNRDGKRLDNWEHLDPSSEHYLTRNPEPNSTRDGHDLNMLTSAGFLAAVGRQPWCILRYDIGFERKPVPAHIDRTQASDLDMSLRSFSLVAQKVKRPHFSHDADS